MREILFRAKRIDNGKWVEGTPYQKYVEFWKEWEWFIQTKHPLTNVPYMHLEIDRKTICEFTGLTDKNGKKIFEGDVVKAVIVRDLGGGTENRAETGIIGYDKIGMIGLIARYAGTIPVWSDFFQELTLSGCITDFWFDVIGNIHDNPEMLGGER